MEMGMFPLVAMAAAALFVMFHGLGAVHIVQHEMAVARVVR